MSIPDPERMAMRAERFGTVPPPLEDGPDTTTAAQPAAVVVAGSPRARTRSDSASDVLENWDELGEALPAALRSALETRGLRLPTPIQVGAMAMMELRVFGC